MLVAGQLAVCRVVTECLYFAVLNELRRQLSMAWTSGLPDLPFQSALSDFAFTLAVYHAKAWCA
jgi:hypothetical protein